MTSAAATIFPEDDRPSLTGWIAAALLVVAAHVILAFLIVYTRDEGVPGVEVPPAIMIDLAPEPAAPASEEQMDVPEAPVKTEQAQPDEAKPMPPEQMVQPVEPPAETPPPPPQTVVVPEAPLAPKPEAVLAPPPKPTPPKPAPKVEKKIDKPVKKPPAEKTAAPKHVDAPPSRNAAQSETGAPSMSSANWKSMVAARIRNTPIGQCPSGVSGTKSVVTLSFSVDGSGNVTSAHGSGSGSAALDQAAAALVRRAGPFPPPPPGIGGAVFPLGITCQ